MTDRLPGDKQDVESPSQNAAHNDAAADESGDTQPWESPSESVERLDEDIPDTQEYVLPAKTIDDLDENIPDTEPLAPADKSLLDSQEIELPLVPDDAESVDKEGTERGTERDRNSEPPSDSHSDDSRSDDSRSDNNHAASQPDKPKSDTQTTVTVAPEPEPEKTVSNTPMLTKLYDIPYIRWERWGSAPLETRRAQLLDQLAETAEIAGDSVRVITLDGQTVILEDVSKLRPELLHRLIGKHQYNHIDIGVWYVQVDDTLVSGESLIRNLLQARDYAEQYGLMPSRVAFMPGFGAHTPQLPQILRGFGLDAAFLYHGAPIAHLPFSWQAPDDSKLLVISAETTETDVKKSIKTQQRIKPDGPFLWLSPVLESGIISHDLAQDVTQETGIPVGQHTLTEYVKAVRESLPDELRPTLRGEMRFQTGRKGSYLLSGTTSARLYLKQANMRMQNLLTYSAEPLLTLALTHSKHDEAHTRTFLLNAAALLQHSWRTLIKNQARAALGGYSVDSIHRENELRFHQVADSANEVINRALNALPGELHPPNTPTQTGADAVYAVVWNGHSWDRKQVVQLALKLPAGKHPAALVAPDGENVDFVWDAESKSIEFLADVPAMGYASYTVQLGDELPAEEHQIKRYNATHISDTAGSTLLVENSRLIWRHFSSGSEISDLLRFIDGGDAGDAFNFSPPEDDIIEQANLVGAVQVEETPFYRRLILRHRMRVAGELTNLKKRERGLRLLDVHTTATFYNHQPGVYFRTELTDTANDHRLRVHLKTGIDAENVLADAPFGVVERRIKPQGEPFATDTETEGVSSTYPMQTACAVESAQGAMALIARGLPEFEAINENKQITLALTLVRAVGTLSRDTMRTRRASLAPSIPVPDAQCNRDHVFEYALVPVPLANRAALMRTGQNFSAPLHTYQYDAPPEDARKQYLSLVEVDDTAIKSAPVQGEPVTETQTMTMLGIETLIDDAANHALITALKPPQTGEGWIVRLINPNDIKQTVELRPHTIPVSAELVSLSEITIKTLDITGKGAVRLELEPHKIVTLRLRFREPTTT